MGKKSKRWLEGFIEATMKPSVWEGRHERKKTHENWKNFVQFQLRISFSSHIKEIPLLIKEFFNLEHPIYNANKSNPLWGDVYILTVYWKKDLKKIAKYFQKYPPYSSKIAHSMRVILEYSDRFNEKGVSFSQWDDKIDDILKVKWFLRWKYNRKDKVKERKILIEENKQAIKQLLGVN